MDFTSTLGCVCETVDKVSGALAHSFVLLIKDLEDEERVIYRFGPDEQRMGRIELNKKEETIQEIEPVLNAMTNQNTGVQLVLKMHGGGSIK